MTHTYTISVYDHDPLGNGSAEGLFSESLAEAHVGFPVREIPLARESCCSTSKARSSPN
jgi:hypothetical protein